MFSLELEWMERLSATSTLVSTKLPTEPLFSGISTLSTRLLFTYSTRLLADSSCLWLVWDLDISKEEKMEECWLATNSTLTSTKLLSFCNSC